MSLERPPTAEPLQAITFASCTLPQSRRKRALAACLLTALLVLLAVSDSRQRQRHSPANRNPQASWGAIVHIQPDAPEASQRTAGDSAGAAAGSTARSGGDVSDGGSSGAARGATAGAATQTGRQGASGLQTGLPRTANRQAAAHRTLEGADPQTSDTGGASAAGAAERGGSGDRRPAVFLFAGVLSGRGYRHRRLAVREAWAHRAQVRLQMLLLAYGSMPKLVHLSHASR